MSDTVKKHFKKQKYFIDAGILTSYFKNRFAPSRTLLTEVDRGEKGGIKTEGKEN